MKIGIFDISSGNLLSVYEAENPAQGSYGGAWGDPVLSAHVEIPDGMDSRACSLENGAVVEDEQLKADLTASDVKTKVKQAVDAAVNFGSELMKDFATENILMGVTQDNKAGDLLTALAPIQPALTSGSLYELIKGLKAIPEDLRDQKYLTDARILGLVNKVETYLKLPLSTSLD